jgi:transcription antitermination protein NusB
MQMIYAYSYDRTKTVERLEKTLLENINLFSRAFLYNLYLLEKTSAYANTDLQIQASKHLAQDDRLLSAQIFFNPIIQHLVNIEPLEREIRHEKLESRIDTDYFRQFFQALKKTKEYEGYASKINPLLTDDLEVVSFLYQKILCGSELFQQHLEEIFASWLDDRDSIFHLVLQTLQQIAPGENAFIVRQASDIKEEKNFGIQLLRETILHDAESEEILTSLLQHWQKERVAVLDWALMKMALTEMSYFPEIPTKVSINEYIELAKAYSTPKSNEFINGILDSALKRLQQEGRIQKTGRGLQESASD